MTASLPRKTLLAFVLGMTACLWQARALAQSNAVSEASTASLDSSVDVPIAVYDALAAGARFTLTGVTASARGTVMTISLVPVAGSIVLVGSLEPDYNLISGEPRTSVGKAVIVSGGLMLELGERVIAFIPEPRARPHIHSKRLTR